MRHIYGSHDVQGWNAAFFLQNDSGLGVNNVDRYGHRVGSCSIEAHRKDRNRPHRVEVDFIVLYLKSRRKTGGARGPSV